MDKAIEENLNSYNEMYNYYFDKINKIKDKEYIENLSPNNGYRSSSPSTFYHLMFHEIYFNKDFKKAKEYLYWSALAIMNYEDWDCDSNNTVIENSMNNIFKAIVANDDKLLDRYVNFESKLKFPLSFHRPYTLPIQLFYKGEKEEFKKCLDYLEERFKVKSYAKEWTRRKGVFVALKGLYNQDKSEIEEGILYTLKKERLQPNSFNPINWISIDAIGLAKMALKIGIEIDIKHDRFYPELVKDEPVILGEIYDFFKEYHNYIQNL